LRRGEKTWKVEEKGRRLSEKGRGDGAPLVAFRTKKKGVGPISQKEGGVDKILQRIEWRGNHPRQPRKR